MLFALLAVLLFLQSEQGLGDSQSPPQKRWWKMRAQLNFLELLTDGNETQNIRLFDGDTVVVARSPIELREWIIKAGQTNLSPDFLEGPALGAYVIQAPKCCRKEPLSIKLSRPPEARSYYAAKWSLFASTATAVLTDASSLLQELILPAPTKIQFLCPEM